jgi:murein L,D-transpeptidase YafK
MKKISAIILTLSLSACASFDSHVDSRRGLAPQSASLVTATERVGATATSPTLIRIFKESRELELWKMAKDGKFELVRTYDICAFSGELGPKLKQGDRQAPEGFYSISSSQMNYNSIRFLSMNTGFPNAYDRAHNATGHALMLHGGCDSAGCYAIQDGPMQEVFTSVRDSLKAGQKSVQMQIYPFRMSKWAMYTNSNNKNIDFWRQLKFGYDKFEMTARPLDVNVVKGRYSVK